MCALVFHFAEHQCTLALPQLVYRGVPIFGPIGEKRMHALKGLACRKRVAAPGLLAHASVTEAVKICPMGPKLGYTAVAAEGGLRSAYSAVCVMCSK